MQLPFDGRWFVYQGGDTPNANHHMTVRAQWFAVDFVKVGGKSERALSSPDPKRLEDFYSWNARVRSPVTGIVIDVVDNLPDNPLGMRDESHPAGNRVVIDAADERYVVLAHFRSGSIVLRKGMRVAAGDYVGRVGNSGNSDFPHLHLHVQNALTADASGINPFFADMDVELTGKTFEDVTWPLIRGLFVESRRPPLRRESAKR